MLSKPSGEGDSDSDGDEGIASKKGAQKKVVFQIVDVPLHYTRGAWKTMASNLSRKSHHVNVREKAVHVWREGHRTEMFYFVCAEKGTERSPQGIRDGQLRGMQFLDSAEPRRYTSL